MATYEVLDEAEVESLKEDAVAENVNDIEVKVTPFSLDKPTVVQQPDQSLVICVKSYGDYRYIDSNTLSLRQCERARSNAADPQTLSEIEDYDYIVRDTGLRLLLWMF